MSELDLLISDLKANHACLGRDVSIYSRAIAAIKGLQAKLDRCQTIASNSWVQAWHDGNGFMALTEDDTHECVLRCWQESEVLKALKKLNSEPIEGI